MDVKKGEIFIANLQPTLGHEQSGVRPVLILQNDIGNKHSPTTIIAPITSKVKSSYLPVHVPIKSKNGMPYDSCVLCEQIRTIDKTRLIGYIGCIDEEEENAVKEAVLRSLDYLELE
jgi:mRNA interferase MazF